MGLGNKDRLNEESAFINMISYVLWKQLDEICTLPGNSSPRGWFGSSEVEI
jgi:hypothetical protein